MILEEAELIAPLFIAHAKLTRSASACSSSQSSTSRIMLAPFGSHGLRSWTQQP